MVNATKLSITLAALMASTSVIAVNVQSLPYNSTTAIVNDTTCQAATTQTRVGASKDVRAAYDCSTSNVGIATAAVKGTGIYYTVHSAGSTVKPNVPTTGVTNGRWTSDATAKQVVDAQATAILEIADSTTSN